jgi:hypothetical protein
MVIVPVLPKAQMAIRRSPVFQASLSFPAGSSRTGGGEGKLRPEKNVTKGGARAAPLSQAIPGLTPI